MNFARTPKTFDTAVIIAEVESAVNHHEIIQNTAKNIKAKIVGVLNRLVHIHNNLFF